MMKSSEGDRMLRTGQISAKAAKRIQASRMADFDSKARDEGAGKQRGFLKSRSIDQNQSKSNMSKGARAGAEKQPVGRASIDENRNSRKFPVMKGGRSASC
jgi:hypothetical protein